MDEKRHQNNAAEATRAYLQDRRMNVVIAGIEELMMIANSRYDQDLQTAHHYETHPDVMGASTPELVDRFTKFAHEEAKGVKPARLSPPPRIAPAPATATVSRSSSPKPEPSSPYARLRPPPGLVWTTFKISTGADIPILKVVGKGETDNYAAVKNTRPSGTYTIYRLEPRKPIAYKCLAKDIRHYIEQDIKHEQTYRENLAFTKRQEEARIAAEKQAFLNQPGFYIVPGESYGLDEKVYNASGPYYRFEKAGINPDYTYLRFHAAEMQVDPNFNDVEDDAIKTANSSPHEHVKIIEARNPLEAAAGRGHVWWQDGLFRGSPVDPRQQGFKW